MGGLSLGMGLRMSAGRKRATAVGIYGFSKPASPPDVYADLIQSQNVAEIIDTTGWSVQSNDAAFSISGGKITKASTSAASRQMIYTASGVTTANRKIGSVAYVDSIAGSNMTLAVANGSSTKSGAEVVAGRWMTNIVTDGVGALQSKVTFPAATTGSLESIHLFDLDAMLAKKWFIVPVVAQSNWVGSTRIMDPALDTPAYGCLAVPGGSLPARGWTLDGSGYGVPALACDPMMHTYAATWTAGGTDGGGPGGAFLRELRKYIPADYTIVYVCTGYAGQGFSGNNYWYKSATTHTAYDNFWAQLRHVMDSAPVGSLVGGMVSCIGEADVGSGQQAQHITRWTAFVSEVRAEAARGNCPAIGNIPVVISQIGGDDTVTNNANMMAAQAKFDSNSGDATAISRCKYVARPAFVNNTFYAGDGLNVHYLQNADRQRGIDVAQAMRDLIYPNG